jgi:hypothetical protein
MTNSRNVGMLLLEELRGGAIFVIYLSGGASGAQTNDENGRRMHLWYLFARIVAAQRTLH